MGSGTTAVAAKILGCDYIGIDTSLKYIEEAKTRIKSSDKERPRVDVELSKHFVNKTFAERKAEKRLTGRYAPNYLIGENRPRKSGLFAEIAKNL